MAKDVLELESVEDFQESLRSKAMQDEDFRARLVADPKAVIEEELDFTLPDGFMVHVHEDTAMTGHLVLPPSAAIAESDMEAVAGGGDMDWCSPA